MISEDYRHSIPIAFSVFERARPPLQLKLKHLDPQVDPGQMLRFVINLESGLRQPIQLNLSYWVESGGRIAVASFRTLQLLGNQDLLLELPLPAHLLPGDYLLVVQAEHPGMLLQERAKISIGFPWGLLSYFLIPLACLGSGYYLRKALIRYRQSRARYPLGKIIPPRGQLYLGRIPTTKSKLMFPIQELRNHLAIAGAAGTGKSLAAMVIAEELLERGIPVMVLDSSKRWSGFLRPCSDPNLLRLYKQFKLSRERARGFPALIQPASLQNLDLEFQGAELRIYLTEFLPSDRIQEFYGMLFDAILKHYPIADELKLVIICEEINRLLETGQDGVRILERALREFRARGVGLILTLPLMAGLPEELKTNIKTELQFHTKSMAELERIEHSYGKEYLKYVSGAGIGVCLVHNPDQNLGKPYFLQVRPSYHHPYSIPKSELELYLELVKRIEKLKAELPPEKHWDLDQVLNHLKQGKISLARMYLESLGA